jgi:hypothetical protein
VLEAVRAAQVGAAHVASSFSVPQDKGDPSPSPATLAALCLIARLRHVAADPAHLAHQLCWSPSRTPDTQDLLLAACHLGLKAKLARRSPERLSRALALVQDDEGRSRVLMKDGEEVSSGQMRVDGANVSAEQVRRQAEAVTVRKAIATLPLAQQREADFKKLTDQGFMSVHAGRDCTREPIEQERDLATQKARLAEAQAAIGETANARADYLTETQRTLSECLAQAALKREQLLQERGRTAAHLPGPASFGVSPYFCRKGKDTNNSFIDGLKQRP